MIEDLYRHHLGPVLDSFTRRHPLDDLTLAVLVLKTDLVSRRRRRQQVLVDESRGGRPFERHAERDNPDYDSANRRRR